MSIDTHTSAQPSRPEGRGPGYQEGAMDAVTETREVIAYRIAVAYDHANVTSSAAAQQWADDYAAGAIATWVLIDRLEVHLQTLGAL